MSEDDLIKLMETTGKIKQGEKVYEPFAEYLKQRAIYEEKYGEWMSQKMRIEAANKARKRKQKLEHEVKKQQKLREQ